MDIEQRVTALEQELQVLKNEIQATLLDIQAQMLTAAYPALRAEDASADARPPQEKSASPAQPAVTAADAPESTPEAAPIVRKVYLGALPEASEPVDPAARIEEPPAAEPLAVPPTIPTLLAPAREPEPARPHTWDDARPSAPSRPVPPSARPTPRPHRFADPVPQAHPFVLDDDPARAAGDGGAQVITAAEWATLEQLEDWTRRRIEKHGASRTRTLIRRYVDDGRIAPELEPSLLQLVSIVADAEPESAASPAGALFPAEPAMRPSRPAAWSEPPHNGASHEEPAPDDSEPNTKGVSSQLVLRLIAGLANAGSPGERKAGRRNGHG